MPTAVGPNTKGEENLVFGYDLGDVSNSYKGEPTTNIIDGGANRATAVTGVWTHGNHAGANSSEIANIDLSATYPNRSSVIKVKTTNATGYGMINQRMSTNAISGSTYTYSFDYKQIAYDGTWTPTAGAYGDGYKVPNSSYTNVNTTYQYIPLSDGWTRFVMTYDATYTGRNTLRSNMQTNNTADFEILLDNFQIQAGDHATPFTAGTRSATQGLLDHTGNSTIDLSNVSFDSDAQMTFDGTDDYVTLPTGLLDGTGDFTVEAVIQADASEIGGTVFGNYPSGNLQVFFGSRFIGMFLDNNSTYLGTSPWSDTLPEFTTNPVHIVAGRSGTATYFYINGELKKTGSSSSTIGSTSAVFRAGTNTNTTEQFTGDIFLLKTYNRALTAAEIKSNFNAIKGRFNI